MRKVRLISCSPLHILGHTPGTPRYRSSLHRAPEGSGTRTCRLVPSQGHRRIPADLPQSQCAATSCKYAHKADSRFAPSQ